MNREQQVEAAEEVLASDPDLQAWPVAHSHARRLAEAIVDRLSPSGAGEEREPTQEQCEAAYAVYKACADAGPISEIDFKYILAAASPSGADPQPDLDQAVALLREKAAAAGEVNAFAAAIFREAAHAVASLSGGAGQQEKDR